MPTVAMGHRHRFTVGKQSAEGTPNTTAAFELPVYGGTITAQEERQDHEATDSLPYRSGQFKSFHMVSGSVEIPSFPDAGPRLAHGVLSSDTVTGGADPYTHTMIRSDTRPWYTFYVARITPAGTFLWDQFIDCRIKAVEWAFSAGQVLRQNIEVVGKQAKFNVTAPTVTTTKSLDATGPWHTMIGATLKIDWAATPATTQKRNLVSGSVRVEYPDEEIVQTDELWGRYDDVGLFKAGCQAEVLVEDYDAYLATFAGSAAASNADPSRAVLVGSLDFLFNVGSVADANRTLQLQMPATMFTVNAPEPDPSGKGLRFELVGAMSHPPTGAPVTALYKNSDSVAS